MCVREGVCLCALRCTVRVGVVLYVYANHNQHHRDTLFLLNAIADRVKAQIQDQLPLPQS